MKNVSYVIGKSFISLVIDMMPFNVKETHVNFELIKERLSNEDYTNIIDLVNESKAIEKKFIDEEITALTIEGSNIFYKGNIVDNSIVNQIIETKNQGYKFDNLMKFLENLLENTSYSIVKELYDWINSGKSVSITSDGAFLAYKKIKEDYKDIYSGTMDNSVGKIVKMERNEVDDNRNNTCSKGLHFCSYDYLNSYGNANDARVVIVKVFPQHVVSIPTDYNFQKGRCSEYEVVGEVENWKDGEYLTKAVDDYDEDIIEIDEDVLEDSKLESTYLSLEEAWEEYENMSNLNDINEDEKTVVDELEDVAEASAIVFKDIVKNLNTPRMTKIYNEFHSKSVKKMSTLASGMSAMRKIYNKDFDYFLRLVEKYS